MSILSGKKAILSDCIMQKNKPARAGSGILEGYISPITAVVIDRLINSGVIISDSAQTDEFGIPRFWDGGSYEITDKITNGTADFALASDIFGCLAQYAAQKGLLYIRPAYGTVSRYGLIPTAASMDAIGVICKDTKIGLAVLSAISGYDKNDGAMYPDTSYTYIPPDRDIKIKTIKPEEAPYIKNAAAAHYIIASAELTANISRYDGISFGYADKTAAGVDELYTKTRRVFGRDVKLAAATGVMVLSSDYYSKYYDKAMRMRRIISESFAFDNYDVLVMPLITGIELSTYVYAPLTGMAAMTYSDNGEPMIAVAAPGKENVFYGLVNKDDSYDIRKAIEILINEADEIAEGKRISANTKDIFGEE